MTGEILFIVMNLTSFKKDAFTSFTLQKWIKPVIDENGNKLINPSPEYSLSKGHKIILIGDKRKISSFFNDVNINVA